MDTHSLNAILVDLYILVAGDDPRQEGGVNGEQVGSVQPRVVGRNFLTLL